MAAAGDADGLLDATFVYNVDDWAPRIESRDDGSRSVLSIEQGSSGVPVGKAIVNKWDLRLNSSVPLDLEVETGAGESVLDLRGLDLADLQVNTGAGQTSIDLSSELQHDLHASVEAGVGDLSVKMPSGMGVRVSAASSIGSLTNTGPSKDGEYYVNEAYGTAPHTLFLDINAGIGSINLLAN